MSHKAGFVNIIGRPNAGKSTLMNKLVGEKLSIINPKVQTTRHRIVGIVNSEAYQIVYSDTPGIIKPNYALQKSMMSFVKEALTDADIILLVIDVNDNSLDYHGVNEMLESVHAPIIGVLTKIDLTDQDRLVKRMEAIREAFPVEEIIPTSALHDFGVNVLQKRIVELLPESPPYYEKDALTDRPMRFFVEEMIRERILAHYEKEVPYSVEVKVEEYKDEEKLVRIAAVIYVMRKSQKGILIGQAGSKLKSLGTDSRKRMEEFLGKKVFLQLYVKVDENWRNKEQKLKGFGYRS